MEEKIDVDSVLRTRLPRHYKWIPGFAVRSLERYICQDRLNELWRLGRGARDSAFAAALLREMNVSYAVESGVERLPDVSVPVTYVSNHPLGALDGICLIDWVSRRHGGVEPAFVVNDLLMAIKPLGGVFIPVNKHGRQSRGAVSDVDRAFSDLSRPVIMFPAGLCSRLDSDGAVRDRAWNKMFVQKSSEAGRTVVPLRFMGENSPGFYRMARLRERVGLRFNLEQIRLPREFVGGTGRRFNIRVGLPIPPEQLLRGHEAAVQAAGIREYIYTL